MEQQKNYESERAQTKDTHTHTHDKGPHETRASVTYKDNLSSHEIV